MMITSHIETLIRGDTINEGFSALQLACLAFQNDDCGYIVPSPLTGPIDSRIRILGAIHQKHPFKLEELQSLPSKYMGAIRAHLQI